MRTRSGNMDTPSTSHGRTNMTDPPPAPPLADVVAALMNVSVGNVLMLQALTQHVIPDPKADHSYREFLKTHPPVFHKAEEPLEAED